MIDTQEEKDAVAKVLGWEVARFPNALYEDVMIAWYTLPLSDKRITTVERFNPERDPDSSNLLLNGLVAKGWEFRCAVTEIDVRMWSSHCTDTSKHAGSTNPDAAAAIRECLWDSAKQIAGVK